MVDINRNEAMDGNLSFTGGQVVLRYVEFDGQRIQADDVYFESEHDNGLIVALSSTNVNSQLVFDIPQGTYSTIRIDFSARRTDFDLNKVTGIYTNSSGVQYPIIVELDRIEFSDRIAKTVQGEVEIDLVAGQPTNALVKLDPIFWFGTISVNQLDNAQTSMVNGVETILINEEINEGLFDIIDDRVGGGVQIIFN